MKTITIPGLNKKVTTLIQGSDYFRPSIYERVCSVLDRYVAIGGNTIDTAHVYCGGESEVAIGQWMRDRNNREDVVILTKGAHHDQNGPRVTPEAISNDLFESLERLGTDYIDLYALHRDDPSIPVQVIIDALNEHIQAGRIKAIGGSNWTVERLQEANEYAAMNGLVGFTFSSPNLSLAKAKEPFWSGCVSVDESDCEWHKQYQFPLLSWSSQARGFFTGRFTPEDRSNEDLVRVFYSDENWERLRRAEQLAKEKGVTTIQIALAYVLNQPFPTCALIGAQNDEELLSCYEGSKIELTQKELTWLEKVENSVK
ncbi:aldo/keto reductase [Bacillus sp. 7586-K]|uniref:Aryl-alcohol dehydrogenase-like predicted oxidoreductase n=1 Tax=Metabacillus niabensis TaxID=324854 RepID=A0ABT9YVF3_9BACI|nr:aldo/keto reductase [Metabacillus niabensis]MDQ0223907.1 aryl-alcohol dehydrogenase-like predicted oxidoreductase [Metabacillus niabensis]PAD70301.1 aldo/keto reductase [Bacillus sp. 7586-K]